MFCDEKWAWDLLGKGGLSKDNMKSIKILLLVMAAWSSQDVTFAQNWTPTGAPNWFWMSIACSADGSKLAAAAGGVVPGPICTSTDSGNTWVTNNVPFLYWSGIASSADGTKLVAIVYNGGIYTSTDSGADWISNSVSYNNWQGVASSADGNTLAVVVDGGGIYFSTNGGTAWNPSDAHSEGWRGIASSADGTRMVAAALNSGVYLSTNSGANWTQTSDVPSEDWDWGCVSSSAKGDKLAVVAVAPQSSNASTYVSTNSGATWTPIPNFYAAAVASSADGNKLVCAASAEGIDTSTNSGLTWNLSYGMFNTNWQAVASSADGGKLFAAWGEFNSSSSGGGISILQTTQAPKMHIKSAGNSVQLSWILPSTNFILRQSGDLTGTGWTMVTNAPALNLTKLQDEVVLPMTGAQSFYQLRTP